MLDSFFKKSYTCIIKRKKEVIKMTRDEMLDRVIRVWGFEDDNTILFAQYIEDPLIDDEVVEILFNLLV